MSRAAISFPHLPIRGRCHSDLVLECDSGQLNGTLMVTGD